MPEASTRFLHVANGDSTTRIIHDAGIPGMSSVWADVLHEGPVPGGLSDEELLIIRARHLAESAEMLGGTIAALNGWRAAIDRHESYDELVLWYEHDLFDQLNLIQVLGWIRRRLPPDRSVSLVCIGSFPGRPHFKGLGELTPPELAPLLDIRQRVSDAQYSVAERAWRAFRAPDPQQIQDVLRTDTSALPFLAAALQRHLEEFPSAGNGLSRTEQRLMELVASRPVDLRSIFPRMHDRETAFYIGDTSFWHVARDLALASPSLVAIDVQPAAPGQLPQGTIRLTEIGQAVLRGEADRVRQCGLERWLGGVHLEGTEARWRWDASERRMVNGSVGG